MKWASDFAKGLLISFLITGSLLFILYLIRASVSEGLAYLLLWTMQVWVPIVLLISVIIILASTFYAVRGNRVRAMGAVAYYPLAVLAAYSFHVYEIAAESAAMQSDYSDRMISQPLGKIAVLGLHEYSGKVVCEDLCAKVLLDGIATEVASLVYGSIIDVEDPVDYHLSNSPWVARRHRLGRGDECRPATAAGHMLWTGPQVAWLQEHGIFDVCIVSRAGDTNLGNMVLVVDDDRARRAHGPKGQTAVAYRLVDGRRSEMVRWEAGFYPLSKKEVGQKFDLFDFLNALSGEGQIDRLSVARHRTVAEAIDELHKDFLTMPDLSAGDIFGYLERLHTADVKRIGPGGELDSDHAIKLREASEKMCRHGGEYLHYCVGRFNFLIDKLLSVDRASKLHLPNE